MKKSKKIPRRTAYKHREVLTWRGLSYRYDKTYGVWRLLDKPVLFGVPTKILEWGEGGARWEAGSFRDAASPVAALEGWRKSLAALRRREAREAVEAAKSLRAEVRRLGSKNLKE